MASEDKIESLRNELTELVRLYNDAWEKKMSGRMSDWEKQIMGFQKACYCLGYLVVVDFIGDGAYKGMVSKYGIKERG